MGQFNTSYYRGFEIFTAVNPVLPPNTGFIGVVRVKLNGVFVGEDTTELMSHFVFAEGGARGLGHKIADYLLNDNPNQITVDQN
ncbi:hypothetical protein [Duganella fentianensis]|uniref:hypothetical protein n=1 Tax=Duganella fentianensis TaxID=2692177 RepID=UPI0032B115D9